MFIMFNVIWQVFGDGSHLKFELIQCVHIFFVNNQNDTDEIGLLVALKLMFPKFHFTGN